MFIYCCFSSFYSRIFHSYGDVTIAGECCEYMYKPMMVIEQEGCRQGASLVLWCVTGHVALGVEAGHFFRFSFNFLIFFAFFNLGALFTFRFPFTILRACTITTNRFLFKFCYHTSFVTKIAYKYLKTDRCLLNVLH